MSNEHREFSGMDLHQPFAYGKDKNLSSSPSRGDAYFAYDTQRLYVCSSSDTWSYVNFSNINNSAFNIDANGIISTEKQSSVKVYLANDFSISSNILTIVEWDTVSWDIQKEFSLITNFFVPKVDGKYLSICNIQLNLTAGDLCNLRLFVNEVNLQAGRHDFDSGNRQNLSNTTILDLKAGDEVAMKVINTNDADTLSGYSTGRRCNWSIQKLM